MLNSRAKTIFPKPSLKLFLPCRTGFIVAMAVVTLAIPLHFARGDEVTKLRDDWDITLGGGLRYGPAYESGRDYQWQAVPYFDAEWYDINGHERTFISTEDGIGLAALSTDHWQFGPLLFWRSNRRSDQSNTTHGLLDNHNSLQAGAFLEYDPQECCDVFIKTLRDVSGTDHGVFIDMGGEINAPIAPSHWFAGLKLTTTWANNPGLQSMFGITPLQSQRDNLPVYSPSHGFRDVELDPSITYQFDAHWATQALFSYERLLDTVADSPLVQHNGTVNQFSAGIVLLYHF